MTIFISWYTIPDFYMHSRFVRNFLPLAALALFGAGCILSTGPATGPDGGVWKTADGGTTWSNLKALVVGTQVTAAVDTTQILQVAFDPQDNNTVYLATVANGLLYSLNAGASWQYPSGDIMNNGRIGAIAVDPKDKCTVYAAKANVIYETTDCGRDWKQIFFDPRVDVAFTQLVVDWYNPTSLWSGTSAGDVFHSQDSGATWQISQREDGSAIVTIALDPRDSRTVYAATYGAGLIKTTDGGNTWTQIYKQFPDLMASDAKRAIQLVIDPVTANTIYEVSKYGILKSTDGGDTWTALKLTSPPESVAIKAMAIDPKDDQNIVYTGVGVLQFTSDGGNTWKPEKLPTTQSGNTIMYDPVNSKVLYLGTIAAPKQN